MSRLLSTLMVGAFAIGSEYAVADGMVDTKKQTELDHIIATGQTNAPLRGEMIAKSALASQNDPAVLGDVSVHERALDYIIATGQTNAPLRGEAIAKSAAVSASQLRVLSGPDAHAATVDKIIAGGNHNGGA